MATAMVVVMVVVVVMASWVQPLPFSTILLPLLSSLLPTGLMMAMLLLLLLLLLPLLSSTWKCCPQVLYD
jgi:hypothetical protein